MRAAHAVTIGARGAVSRAKTWWSGATASDLLLPRAPTRRCGAGGAVAALGEPAPAALRGGGADALGDRRRRNAGARPLLSRPIWRRCGSVSQHRPTMRGVDRPEGAAGSRRDLDWCTCMPRALGGAAEARLVAAGAAPEEPPGASPQRRTPSKKTRRHPRRGGGAPPLHTGRDLCHRRASALPEAGTAPCVGACVHTPALRTRERSTPSPECDGGQVLGKIELMC